ncbi:lysophospholipid acyltransferase family protein [Oryzicola mucosus]|uniref:Lysophospholipid acyltransferase family protein n=1 Tax=Oryzicola mucosus TaxID=2767425 RepID=A0A8J6U0I3_9HYPH|nr:lysophospholipid acyltransferase family protein [Oryzicola mucosus]MBD0415691.1 lysophospholipid acyltransferase family protein [Oryzicola mucosus]
MDQRPVPPAASRPSGKKARGSSASKSFWRRIRQPLAQSRFSKSAIASLLSGALRFIRLTNPLVPESRALMAGAHASLEPVIIALWHGQHLMAPTIYPSKRGLVAMVSRSADAELNAMVIQRFGIDAVRGSGGRENTRGREKGGATALIALKKALDGGKNVCMIADIPHGTPRDSGMGIILLARLSGRPIVPAAITTSRRKVLERSWDKTTISLPFGRSAIVAGTPVEVSPDATEAEMEEKRLELTASLNAATVEAYRLVDRRT